MTREAPDARQYRRGRSILFACLSVLLALPAPAVAAGRDIVRILPPEFQPKAPEAPKPPEQKIVVPQQPPTQPKRVDPPPPSQEKSPTGEFVKMQARLGSMVSDAGSASLGASFDTLDRPLAIAIGLMNPSGALVLDAGVNSPASNAGIRPGDVVVSFNGGPVASPAELRRRILAQRPGDTANVEVWRYRSDLDFVATLRRFAEQGNAAVMYRLGRMYERGTGAARDETEAVRWFRMGANAGNSQAMAELGMMLLDGRGTTRNTSEGLSLLKSAADSDNANAQWRYGIVLSDGKYTTKDTAQAAVYFERAAQAGYSPAMVDLGLLHANGNGVPRNYQAAARWYEKAIALNHPAAMVNLGILYQRGNGVEKDETRAAELYRRAADLNQPAGMHNYAALLDAGRGVPRDTERAAELVMKALRYGHDFSYRQMTNNSAGYTREFKMALQRRLKDEGVYSGPIDGDFGQSTQAAITTFFNKHKR